MRTPRRSCGLLDLTPDGKTCSRRASPTGRASARSTALVVLQNGERGARRLSSPRSIVRHPPWRNGSATSPEAGLIRRVRKPTSPSPCSVACTPAPSQCPALRPRNHGWERIAALLRMRAPPRHSTAEVRVLLDQIAALGVRAIDCRYRTQTSLDVSPRSRPTRLPCCSTRPAPPRSAKGVVVTAWQSCRQPAMIRERFGVHARAAVYLTWLPLFHDMGLMAICSSRSIAACRAC